MTSQGDSDYEFDVFISYASEDRGDFVTPLFDALEQRGLRVWIDYGQITLGDSLRQEIDDGLIRSRFGVIVLSPHSIEKFWTNLEWDGLLAKEDVSGIKRILPVRHGLSHEELLKRSPILAGRLSAESSGGLDAVVSHIVEATGSSLKHPPRQATNLYGVPRRQFGFVGRRKEIEGVSKVLLGNRARPVSASISGLAGIGKTAFATELIHCLAEAGEFPGGIFWLDAQKTALDNAWAAENVGGQLAGEVAPSHRVDETIRRISRMKADVLVVLDNVTDWSSTNCPRPLPQGAHVNLLITTQESNLGGRDFAQVALDALDQDDARRLLIESAGRNIEPGVDGLLTALDGYALAIELAGGYLVEEGTAKQYLLDFEIAVAEREASRSVRYQKTTEMALTAIWERLDSEGQDAWCRAACFEPESVGVEISNEVGVDRAARNRLRRYNIIKMVGGIDGNERWVMHRLVREFGVQSSSGEIQRASRNDFVKGCDHFVSAIEFSAGDTRYGDESTHLDAELARRLEGVLTEEDLAFLGGIAKGRFNIGAYSLATAAFEQQVAVGHRELGKEHPVTLFAMNDLGEALHALGELDRSREIHEYVLDVRRRVFGIEHPATLTSTNNLALILKAQGNLADAHKLMDRAVEIRRLLLGEEHPDTLISKGNLAQMLRDKGRLEESLELIEQVVEVHHRMLGEEDPITLTGMNNMGLLLMEQGELTCAHELLKKVLRIRRRVLGDEHPDTLISMDNLGQTLQRRREWTAARDLHQSAFDIHRRVLGPEHPHSLIAMNALAGALVGGGDLRGAQVISEKLLKIRRRVFGEEHPATISSVCNLGFILSQQGDLAGARELVEGVVEVSRRKLDPDDLLRQQLEVLFKMLNLS